MNANRLDIPNWMRQFRNYTAWEDFKAGMYALPSVNDEPLRVKCAARLLSNPNMFYKVAARMVDEWRTAATVHLSNTSRNRQAWIGQASCCFAFDTPEHQTKEAWHTLTEGQQRRANAIADAIIKAWENIHAETPARDQRFIRRPRTYRMDV